MRNFLIFLIVFVLSVKLYGASETAENRIIFGVYGGRSDISGYYKDKINSGYNLGIFINYSFFKNYLLLESDLSYTDMSLKDSSTSKFNYYSLGFGPVLYFSAWRYLKPYAGFLAAMNYFDLTAVKTNKNEKTIKPGAVFKAGFYIPVYKDISIKLGLKYLINELSGKTFQCMTYFAGASYSYNFISKERAEETGRQIEIDEYYESGLRFFRMGDGLKAKEYFDKVISYNANYKDVKNYYEIITANEKNYEKALQLISENKIFEAIPSLIDAEKYLFPARDKLHEIRSALSSEENNLTELGINAYDQNDYEKCIYYMKRVQLINPENESIKIYLPRAIKRYNALQKLE